MKILDCLIKFGHAPGNYMVCCRKCGNSFFGDKRAILCLNCVSDFIGNIIIKDKKYKG